MACPIESAPALDPRRWGVHMHDMTDAPSPPADPATSAAYVAEIDAARAECACFRVRHAARAVTRAYDEALRPVGLRATQFSILAALESLGDISITDLAAGLGMDRTTLSRNLRPLERQGLVALASARGAGTRAIRTTPAGRTRFAEAVPHWRTVQTKAVDALGEARWRSLKADLAALESAL